METGEGAIPPQFLMEASVEEEIVNRVQRDLGRMEAEIKSLGDTLGEVKEDMKQVRQSFDEMKGGVRFLMTAAAGVGGLVALIISWLSTRH